MSTKSTHGIYQGDMLRVTHAMLGTGETFTFEAGSSIDLDADPATLTAKECILHYLRLTYHVTLTGEGTAEDKQKFIEAYQSIPIMQNLIGEIRIKRDSAKRGEILCEITILPQIVSVISQDGENWTEVVHSPDADHVSFFKELVEHCMQLSEVQRAIQFYLKYHPAESIADFEGQADTQSRKQPSGKEYIKMSMHFTGQTVGRLPAFDADPAEWTRNIGPGVNQPIDRYGVDLTDVQLRVLMAVIQKFTQTRYRGNMPAKSKEELQKEYLSMPNMLKNIDEIPRTSFGKRELVELCGMNYDNQGDVEHVMNALGYLSTTSFCFYYNRLQKDISGKPIINKGGKPEKELVIAFDTLLKLKAVLEEKTNRFKYYEIEPSGIFLDQNESYFMLIPTNWWQEVRGQVGTKKSSKFLYRFLLFLRREFELKRRQNRHHGSRTPYEIKYTKWQDLASDIRMPESVYKDQPTRATKTLTECIETAKQLGYIAAYEWAGSRIKIVLNPPRFPQPKDSELPEPSSH